MKKENSIYSIKATITNQITIPKKLRDHLGISTENRRILIVHDKEGIHLKRVNNFMKWAGAFTGKQISDSQDQKRTKSTQDQKASIISKPE